MVSSTNNRSQEQPRILFDCSIGPALRTLVSIRFGFSSYASTEKIIFLTVIVVGSGASGGWACKRLSEAGTEDSRCLESRPPAIRQKFHRAPARIRAQVSQQGPRTHSQDAAHPGSNSAFCKRVYLRPGSSTISRSLTPLPATSPLTWMGPLVRMTGGRTNVWGRVSPALQRLGFQGRLRSTAMVKNWPARLQRHRALLRSR